MLDNGLASITMIQRDKTPIFPIEWVVKGQSSKYLFLLPKVLEANQMFQAFTISKPHLKLPTAE